MSEQKTTQVSVVIIGAGEHGRNHARAIFSMGGAVRVAGFVEPSEHSRELMRKFFADHKQDSVPPFFNTLEEFLATHGPADCAIVISPHSMHADHIVTCLESGMDTLAEKPMVVTPEEALRVIRARDATGRFLSVAYPSSYSPGLQKAKELIAAGEIGALMSMHAFLAQGWRGKNIGTWRQIPEISGGGFLFDTGSHTINTMLELAGSEIAEVAVMQDNRGTPVAVATAMAGRFENGAQFTFCAEGNSGHPTHCQSRVTAVGDKATLMIGSWGDGLRIYRHEKGEEAVAVPAWDWNMLTTFLQARKGEVANPCPAENGLRFAVFMEKVRAAVK